MKELNKSETNEEYNLDKEIEYINNEIIAKQVNGNYCKYSKLLHAVSIMDLTEEQYIKYYMSKAKTKSVDMDKILEAIHDKLYNNLTDTETMIKLIEESKDRDSEKRKAIELLGGVYNG